MDGFILVSQYGDGQEAFDAISNDKLNATLMDINLPSRHTVDTYLRRIYEKLHGSHETKRPLSTLN